MAAVSPQETVAIIKATVPAPAEHGVAITETMYRRLFETPEIAALFNQANQKSGAQLRALGGAILAYAGNIENLGALGGAAERIAQKHIGYAILPEHYPYVAIAPLGAIEEVLGDAATPQILAAWERRTGFWRASCRAGGRHPERDHGAARRLDRLAAVHRRRAPQGERGHLLLHPAARGRRQGRAAQARTVPTNSSVPPTKFSQREVTRC